MLDVDAVARWLIYRANRNSTAHDYSEDFVTQTLTLLPAYLRYAHALLDKIEHGGDDALLTLDFPSRHLPALVAMCQLHLPQATVWAYGSRVTGTPGPMSDLDLVVRHHIDPQHVVAGVPLLAQALSDSLIPISIDVPQ